MKVAWGAQCGLSLLRIFGVCHECLRIHVLESILPQTFCSPVHCNTVIFTMIIFNKYLQLNDSRNSHHYKYNYHPSTHTLDHYTHTVYLRTSRFLHRLIAHIFLRKTQQPSNKASLSPMNVHSFGSCSWEKGITKVFLDSWQGDVEVPDN